MTSRRPVCRGFQGLRPWWGRGATPLVCLLALACTPPSALAETAPAGAPGATCKLEDGEDRRVTRVVDGETLMLDGGSEVRLIGALAPRAFDAADATEDWPLMDRARTALERLIADRQVRLAFSGRRSDRYGRLLAHVFSGTPERRVWLQGELLKQGLARAYALEGSTQCLQELIAHEALARESATGLWGEAVYAVRSADEVPALLRLAGTFQIVEGKVHGVSEIRGTTYINFGEDFRQDFTVMLRQPARRTMTSAALAVESLASQRIRVRGWIERRGGPMIEIGHAAAIEVLAPEPEEAEPAAPTAPRRRSRKRSEQAR